MSLKFSCATLSMDITIKVLFAYSKSDYYSEYERLSTLNLLPLKYSRKINDLVFFFNVN